MTPSCGGIVHLRIIAPPDTVEQALRLLDTSPAVFNIIHLAGVARKPDGDVILCDVAREDTSVLLNDLWELGIPQRGSIAVETVDTEISAFAVQAEQAAAGLPTDAVIWEEVEAHTSESVELSASFLVFMILATMLAGIGIILDSSILIVGAMVVGPEFGPIAGFCVAVIQRSGELARRSILALAIGFPLGIIVTLLATLLFRITGIAPNDLATQNHPLTAFIANPDAFSFIVACLAGIAGVLSLTTAKSGALIGVLISVTTIPSAGNIAVATAYGNWDEVQGAAIQLGLNLAALLLVGILTLYVQRRLYLLRRKRHLRSRRRKAIGLPRGQGRRSQTETGAR